MYPDPDACEKCGHVIQIGDFPFCRGSAADHQTVRRHTFVPVEVDLGSLGKHTIDSIQAADRLQKMAKEQGQEISFRAFNNDPSNQDRNSIGENRQMDFKTRNRRGVPFITVRGRR